MTWPYQTAPNMVMRPNWIITSTNSTAVVGESLWISSRAGLNVSTAEQGRHSQFDLRAT